MSTGNVVTGDKYFSRPREERKLWRHLSQGAHILLLAPRRVGKTSLIAHIRDNPKGGYAVIYVFVQACHDEQGFYQKLLREIYSSPYISKYTKAKKTLTDWASKINFNLSASPASIDVSIKEKEKSAPNITHEMIRDVLYDSLESSESKVIIAIDEFPDVLEKIADKDGKQGVESFLSGIRALCQDTEFNQKVQFILTGSIGLDTLAEKLGVTDLINMLETMTVHPLKNDEATAFIDFYFTRYYPDITLDTHTKQAIISKVGWNMPYYLGLVCEQLIDIYEEEERAIVESDVQTAIDALFSAAMSTRFSHWRDRLRRLEKIEQKYANQVLDLVSTSDEIITPAKLFNISQHSDFKDTINSRYILNCLLHDGYLYQLEDNSYQFTSPLLKRWWVRYGK